MLFYTWLLRFRTTVEICSSLSCKSDSFSTLKITLLIWLLTTKSLCVRTSVLTSATSVFLSLCLYVHPTVRKSVRVTFLIYDHGASDATVNKKSCSPIFRCLQGLLVDHTFYRFADDSKTPILSPNIRDYFLSKPVDFVCCSVFPTCLDIRTGERKTLLLLIQ